MTLSDTAIQLLAIFAAFALGVFTTLRAVKECFNIADSRRDAETPEESEEEPTP